jgi:hypothetical protein
VVDKCHNSVARREYNTQPRSIFIGEKKRGQQKQKYLPIHVVSLYVQPERDCFTFVIVRYVQLLMDIQVPIHVSRS